MITVRAALLIVLAAGALPASSAIAACLAYRHTGRFAAQQLVCHARVAGTSTPVRPACLGGAETRFDARAGCIGGATVDALRAAAELYVDDVASALASPATAATRDCAARKLRAVKQATRDALVCHQRGGPTVACLSEARGRLAGRLANAESTGPCATTNDFASLAARLDDFATDVLRLLGPDPAPYRGVYDVTFVFDPPWLGPGNPNAPLGMADVTEDGQLRLDVHFDRYDTLTVRGILANGDFPVTGDFFDGGDIAYEAVGQAAATASDGRQISGSADIRGFGGGTVGTVTFTLGRPLAGTPGALGGSYAASFPQSPSDCDCASGATFDLTVPPDGFATFAPATDARPDSTVVGTFAAGTCLVAPGGSVRCTSPYDPVSESGRAAQCAQGYGGACPVTLHGALPVPPVATGGGIYASPPPPLVHGSWTATR